jgi:proline iminopeptidase
MSFKDGFIKVTGGKVYYQMHDTNTGKTPVIVLHGGPGSSHYSLQGFVF